MAEKARYFTFLIYPESSPKNFKELLEQLDRPIAISPLHDKDLNKSKVFKATGEKYKKAHYHCIYVASNPVTAESVRNKLKRLLGDDSVALVQIVKTSVENIYKYLTHESEDAIKKNKHVYSSKELVLLNNFDVARYVTFDVEQKEMYFEIICDLIEEHLIANLLQLRKFIKEEGSNYGLDLKILTKVIANKVGLLRLYFDAAYQERQSKKEGEFAILEEKIEKERKKVQELQIKREKDVEDFRKELAEIAHFYRNE